MAKMYGVLTHDLKVCCGQMTEQAASSLVKNEAADWIPDRRAIRLRRGERHPDHLYSPRGVSASPGPALSQRYLDATFMSVDSQYGAGEVFAAIEGWSQ